MKRLRSLVVRILGLLSRRRQDAELEAELASHLQLHIDDNLRAGMSPAAARRQAKVMLGSVAAVADDWRDARRVPLIDSTVQDLRDGIRAMRRSPLFTAMAVATLAVTIGALSTVVTMSHTLLLRLPAVPEADALVDVQVTRNMTTTGFASYPDYAHFKHASDTLDIAAHYSTAPLFVTVEGTAVDVNGAVVSASYFSVLQLQPAHGRFFLPEEDEVPDRDRVIVVSHAFWQRWFEGAPDVLGAEVTVNGTSFTIVGVAPESFRGLEVFPVEIYMPTMMLRVGYRPCDALAADCTILRMIGRLTDGRSLAEARAELPQRLPAWWADPGLPWTLGVRLEQPRGVGAGRGGNQMVTMLVLAAVVLLLVCCANLAGLLIARGNARQTELAVRATLGASRGRLVRQLLTESVLMAGCGGVTGIALSVGMTQALNAMFFAVDGSGRPQFYDLSLQPLVVATVVGVSLLAGVAFGVLPALRISRVGAANALTRHTRTVSRSTRATSALLGVQAAVAVTLVALAGSFVQSAVGLASGTNYDPDRVALIRLRPRLLGYDAARGQQFVHDVVARLESVPGVQSVSTVGTGVALLGLRSPVALPETPENALTVGYIEVGPRYFETLGTPVLRGREFEAGDTVAAPPVAAVSRALADRLWPGSDPIGEGILVGDRRHTVVGLVDDVYLQSRAEPVQPYVFAPMWQNPDVVDARLQIRVDGDPAALLMTFRREIGRVDPNVPVTEVGTMAVRLAGRFRSLRMNATFVSFAGGLAVALTLIGLYSALAFAVTSRTREIGVRLAMGASPRRILAMVIREGMTMIAAGAVLGVMLAALSGLWLQSLLYGPVAQGAPFVAAAAAVVVVSSLVACVVPAYRASRIAPTDALRHT